MNKQKFNTYIKEPKKLTTEELNSLLSLSKQYPYSQVLHSVIAKAFILSGSREAKNKLGRAAIYSTDRSVLKSFIQSQKTSEGKSKPPISREERINKQNKPQEKQSHQSPGKQVEVKQTTEQLERDEDMDQVRADIMSNLNQLVQLKESINFEQFAKHEIGGSSKHSEKDKINKTKGDEDGIVEEIKSIELEIKEETNTDQKKQIEIIDSFISLETPIKPKGESEKDGETGNAVDLTDKNSDFNDDLVSENLAKILVKQGKISRALDIYKKLIWKYPQKKAYFAAQIESLENNT